MEDKKNNKISKILIIVFIVLIYLMQGYICISGNNFDINTFVILVGLTVVMSLINVMYAIIYFVKNIRIKLNNQDLKSNLKLVLIAKLVLIPFFVINFVLFTLITFGTLIVPVFPTFIIVIMLGISWTYMIFLGITIYAISMIWLLFKENKISIGSAIINTILQFIFILDVISYLYIYCKNSKQLKD